MNIETETLPQYKNTIKTERQTLDMLSLFSIFTDDLGRLGLIVNQGKIIDASFVEVPNHQQQ